MPRSHSLAWYLVQHHLGATRRQLSGQLSTLVSLTGQQAPVSVPPNVCELQPGSLVAVARPSASASCAEPSVRQAAQ